VRGLAPGPPRPLFAGSRLAAPQTHVFVPHLSPPPRRHSAGSSEIQPVEER